MLKTDELTNPFRYMLNDKVEYEKFLSSIRNIRLMHRMLYSSEDAQYIESELAEEMEMLNYERYTRRHW